MQQSGSKYVSAFYYNMLTYLCFYLINIIIKAVVLLFAFRRLTKVSIILFIIFLLQHENLQYVQITIILV